MRWRLLVSCLVAALGLNVPIYAQGQDRASAACARAIQAPQDAIRACTTILNRGGGESQQNPAIAFYNCGFSQQSRGNLDAAITD